MTSKPKMKMVENQNQDLAASSSVLHVLNFILPKVNKLLEENILLITDSFTKIAESSVKAGNFIQSGEQKKAAEEIAQISKNVSSAIVGLQFQDRVSQNLVIADEISSLANTNMLSVINSEDGVFGISALKQIYSKIFLGEIRNEFVDYLLKNGFIATPEEICHLEKIESDKNEEIELF